MTAKSLLNDTLPPKNALHVDPARSPGWIAGSERVPQPGEQVHTHEGTGVVVKLLHKTANGGRVLEVSMDDGRKQPFFAATANVRVRPEKLADKKPAKDVMIG